MKKDSGYKAACDLLQEQVKALGQQKDALEKERDGLRKLMAEGAGDLTPEEIGTIRRARKKTYIVTNPREGTKMCARCGGWPGGLPSPRYCPHCGRPFQDTPEEAPFDTDFLVKEHFTPDGLEGDGR